VTAPARAPSGEAALSVTHLHKAFGSQGVLAGIDLEVAPSGLLAILGPSGSGKTTLLRVLAGFERADAGTVVLRGRVVDDGRAWVPPEERGIGYVPQEGGLFPHLNVERNVAFGLPRSRRHGPVVADYIDMVGLSGFERRFPHELSGGQQQRVALARALAIRPALVLLDEPFSSLDVAMRASVREDVETVLRQSGTAAVLVTHDQDEALSTADRVAVIRDGRIGQVGTPAELYSNPVDPQLASFLGDANFVDGVVKDGVAETPLGRLVLRHPAPPGPAVVLVRPEQIEVDTDPGGPGLPGRVVRADFFGHDCVITVEPSGPSGGGALVARSQGGTAPEVGAAVALTAQGTALAWGADRAGG
jgi:iron(III) transport system ATP-binding protein